MALFQELLMILEIGTEIVLLGVVSMRGSARNCPTFLLYLYWSVLGDLWDFVRYFGGSNGFMTVANVQIACEGLILLAVLFDLARSAVRPLPPSLSRGLLAILGLVTAGAGATLWRFSDSWALLSPYRAWHLLLREQLTSSILRIFLLLLIGGLVEFLSRYHLPLGWGERELQIATGMGVYALGSLAESLATTYWRFLAPTAFEAIHISVVMIFELCLIYWIVCFARPDKDAVASSTDEKSAASDSGPSTLWQAGSPVGEGAPDPAGI